MSHQDIVQKLPKGFKSVASSQNSKFAIIANERLKYYGVQFHPEVSHTENGKVLINNFIYKNMQSQKKMESKKSKKNYSLVILKILLKMIRLYVLFLVV